MRHLSINVSLTYLRGLEIVELKEVNYLKVKISNDQRIFIEFYQYKKRFRLFTVSKINLEIHPNSYPIGRRIEIGN